MGIKGTPTYTCTGTLYGILKTTVLLPITLAVQLDFFQYLTNVTF